MRSGWLRSCLSGLLTILLMLPAGAAPAGEPTGKESKIVIPETGLTDDQKIVHTLNRLGYGPRPGDVERVKRIGLAAYIERQLTPEAIPDGDVEPLLANFKTLRMSPMQLLASYPPPQLLRAVERRLSAQMGMDPEAEGSIFPELAERRARQERRAQQQDGAQADDSKDDAVTRELRRREGLPPEERMREAMRGPARIVIELSQAKLLRAVYSERQLQEVMTDFWFNHFNVFVGKGADRWLTTSYEQQAIRPHALGRFRDLLGATARHPAMLFYLDNWLSADPKADVDERQLRQRYVSALREQGIEPGAVLIELMRQRGLDTSRVQQLIDRQMANQDEGARFAGRRNRRFGNAPQPQRQQQQQRRAGLNENYARELLELHTVGVDGGYTQQDIIEVARCFTGWTLMPPQFGQGFLYVDELHDKGTKTILGHKIENGGQRDGERVLDLLARHPATARFVSTKLARRFVADNPPTSLVEKMARTFQESDGDIRSVLRAMISAPEFWSPETVNAKVKTPLEFVVSAVRATNADVVDLPPGLVLALRELGQPLYGAQPPTGYKDVADVWVSSGGLLNRVRVALGLVANRLPGVHVDVPRVWTQAGSTDELVAQLSQQVLYRAPSETTRAAIAQELAKAKDEIEVAGTEAPARLALGWLLASPEFQRR
jgi:uncharacterized protein (DUF1800 family)